MADLPTDEAKEIERPTCAYVDQWAKTPQPPYFSEISQAMAWLNHAGTVRLAPGIYHQMARSIEELEALLIRYMTIGRGPGEATK